MSEEEKQDAQVAAEAILRRFKVIEINNREESDYWLANISKELKPRQKIAQLVREEVKDEKPKARIALIDRTHNVPTWKKDFSTHQSKIELGKRMASRSPSIGSSDELPDSVNMSDVAEV